MDTSWPDLKLKKKNHPFEIASLILWNKTNSSLIVLWCVMKSGFYMTTGDNQFSRWTEKKLQSTSQSQTCTKKIGSWSLFGGLLPVGSTTAFWIPVKSLHLRSMLSKLMRCTENCNTCSQYWSTEGAQLFSAKMLHITQPMLQKWNELDYGVLFYLSYSPDLSPTNYRILTTFCM